MLIVVEAPFRHRLLGETRDDAAGEAFDKVAKMLGLGYPGGPAIDRAARDGNPRAVQFPRARPGKYEFSFSGIKTAVLYHLRRTGVDTGSAGGTPIDRRLLADLCASFQEAVVDVLVDATVAAVRETGIRTVTLAGGVSANSRLRARMEEETAKLGCRLAFPPLEYCMDNGAMIAHVGWMRLMRGETSPLEIPAVPNLELETGGVS
jgi:N6-L-threonylcarbamoyladenine synthase